MGYTHLPEARLERFAAIRRVILDPLLRHNTGSLLIPVFVERGRLLDVGCGDGAMLRLLHLLGWNDLYGIEPDPEAAERARSTGASIRTARIEDALGEYPDEHFDVIIASMVLEHLDQPYSTFGELARKLRPGGQFLLSTIDRDSIDAKYFGAFWACFDFPRHMTYFRRADIKALVEPYLDQVDWFHQVAPIDWIRGASWRHSRLDELILATPRLTSLASVVFALTGRASRVSVRGRRTSS